MISARSYTVSERTVCIFCQRLAIKAYWSLIQCGLILISRFVVDRSIWRSQLVVHRPVTEVSMPVCRHCRARAVCPLRSHQT